MYLAGMGQITRQNNTKFDDDHIQNPHTMLMVLEGL